MPLLESVKSHEMHTRGRLSYSIGQNGLKQYYQTHGVTLFLRHYWILQDHSQRMMKVNYYFFTDVRLQFNDLCSSDIFFYLNEFALILEIFVFKCILNLFTLLQNPVI